MDSFFEDYNNFKSVVLEVCGELYNIKNPFKRFKLKMQLLKKIKKYIYKVYDYIDIKELDIDFIYNFIQFSITLNSIDVEYKPTYDVFQQLEDITVIYKKDNKPILVFLLYFKRDEIRFAKYADGEIIQYPRHVFIKSVNEQNAVYEYDKNMIRYVKDFIIETVMNDLQTI